MERNFRQAANKIDYELRLARFKANLLKFVYVPNNNVHAMKQIRLWVQELSGINDTTRVNQWLNYRYQDFDLLEKCESKLEQMQEA